MKKITLFLICAISAFVANATGAGVYIRGGVNSWNADANWEFQETDTEGVYKLENKTLMGSFKVADASWSNACNYGGDGTAPVLGTTYNLVSGSNSNIDLGDKTYECTTITLTIDANGNATLLLEGTEQGATEITEVYVMGNNNGWNFTDDSGKLSATSEANVFSGDVTFPAAEGKEMSYWRIYERLGGVGSWGFEVETTTHTTSGTFVKGKEGCCTVNPGTYTVTFNLSTGEFSLVEEGGSDSVADIEASATISAANGEIIVNGAQKVAVYTVGGSLISTDVRTQVANGLYIVRADNQVKKVIVK